jgi:hypothetical protein
MWGFFLRSSTVYLLFSMVWLIFSLVYSTILSRMASLKKRDQRSPVVFAALASSEISSPLVRGLHIFENWREGRRVSGEPIWKWHKVY